MDVNQTAEQVRIANLDRQLRKKEVELCRCRVLLWDSRLEHAKSMVEVAQAQLERAQEQAEPRC